MTQGKIGGSDSGLELLQILNRVVVVIPCAVAAVASGSIVLAGAKLVVAIPCWFVFAGLAAAATVWLSRRQLRPVVEAFAATAAGDRFVVFRDTGSGVAVQFSELGRKLQQELIRADALLAEQQAAHQQQAIEDRTHAWYVSRFRETTDQMVRKLAGAVEGLKSTATELSQQQQHSEETLDTVSTAVHAASGSALQVATIAADLQQVIARSSDSLEASSSAIAGAAENTGRAHQIAGRLAEATRNIDGVIALISAIADQTKLLALNATIEAVRAGAAGAGFGVVAQEVKNLAEQTSEAAKKVTHQMGAVRGAVGETVSVLGDIVASITSVERTSDIIRTAITAQNDQAAAIGAGADGAAEGARAVMEVLPDLHHTLERAAAASTSVLSTSTAVATEADFLEHSVERFFADLQHGAIPVGILHSLSGSLAASETVLKDLLVMLIGEVNAAGGVLGRPLKPIIMNPRSDLSLYADLTDKLLDGAGVAALFGCWTSASRKTVVPIVEAHNNLLFYASQYEGQEQSRNTFYSGAVPNQQALPALDYLMSGEGGSYRRFILVGTEGLYSRLTAGIMQGYLREKGLSGEAVKTLFVPSGHSDWRPEMAQIRGAARGGKLAIVSVVSGEANVYFFRELRRQGITAQQCPVLTLSIGEAEADAVGWNALAGHLTAWNYLSAIDNEDNRAFLRRWRDYCGKPDAVANDAMEATYLGFTLWLEAVREAGTISTDAVRQALAGRKLAAPSGVEVMMDPVNHHLHRPCIIGRFGSDRVIRPVSRSEGTLAPEPYSRYATRG